MGLFDLAEPSEYLLTTKNMHNHMFDNTAEVW